MDTMVLEVGHQDPLICRQSKYYYRRNHPYGVSAYYFNSSTLIQ